MYTVEEVPTTSLHQGSQNILEYVCTMFSFINRSFEYLDYNNGTAQSRAPSLIRELARWICCTASLIISSMICLAG